MKNDNYIYIILHSLFFIYNIIAVSIGFNRTIYTVQEEIGFVTWIVVASGPVDSDIVIRINEITSGRSATSMSL